MRQLLEGGVNIDEIIGGLRPPAQHGIRSLGRLDHQIVAIADHFMNDGDGRIVHENLESDRRRIGPHLPEGGFGLLPAQVEQIIGKR